MPLTKGQANHFFQIIAKRYERGSTILTSNLPARQWDETFCGNATLTVTTLDQLLYLPLQIKGNSYRLRKQARAGLLGKK